MLAALLLRRVPVLECHGQLDQSPVRRRSKAPARLQLGVVELGRTLDHGTDRRMLGLVRLDERPTRPLSPARPADRLRQQLVGPLCGSLVGQVQRDVG
jgi:hypothetical protein